MGEANRKAANEFTAAYQNSLFRLVTPVDLDAFMVE
jgi:hypothetical protein